MIEESGKNVLGSRLGTQWMKRSAAAVMMAGAAMVCGASNIAEASVTDVSTAGTLVWGFDGTDVDVDINGITELNNQAGTTAADASLSGLGTGITSQAQLISSNTGNGTHSVVAFDGGADTFLSDFNTTISGTHQIFIVAKFNENSLEGYNNYIIDGEDEAGRRATGIRGTTATYFASDGGDNITDIPINLGTWQVITLTLGGTTDIFHVTDGTVAGTDSHTLNNAHTHNMTGITIGGRTASPSSVTRFNGEIAEILVYGSDLSAGDVTSVQSHLLEKYIVPEPASLLLLGGAVLCTAIRRRR